MLIRLSARLTILALLGLKIGAVILRNTRRIRFLLSSSGPYQALFHLFANRLTPGYQANQSYHKLSRTMLTGTYACNLSTGRKIVFSISLQRE